MRLIILGGYIIVRYDSNNLLPVGLISLCISLLLLLLYMVQECVPIIGSNPTLVKPVGSITLNSAVRTLTTASSLPTHHGCHPIICFTAN